MIYEKLKKSFVAVLTCLSLLGMVAPAKVEAASIKGYTIVPLLKNDSSPEIITEVMRETKTRNGRLVLKFGKNSPLSDADITKQISGLTESEVQNAVNGSDIGTSNSGQYLEFPGYGTVANIKDQEQARKIAQGISDSLNQAVNIVFQYGQQGKPKKDTKSYADIVRQISNAASRGNSVDIYGVKFTFGSEQGNEKAFTNDIIKTIQSQYLNTSDPTHYNRGATEADFVVIEYPGGKDVLQYSFPKGYGEGQARYDEVAHSVTTNEYITWKGFGWYVCKGYSLALYYGTDAFSNSSDLSNTINEMIYDALSGVLGILGVKNVETLILNRDRGYSYFMGMMPTSWFSVGSILYWAAQIIAIIILFGSVVKLLLKRNVAIISPSERESLKDGIVNIAITIVLLVLFVPIFYILAKTNYLLVDAFASLVGADSLSLVSSASGLAGLLVMVFTMCILLILNIQYFGRSITLLVLYICSPIAISSIAYSGRKSQLFGNWLKELLVNLFIQSLNAAVLALFIIMSRDSQFSALEGILMISAFIPLNKYIKDNVGGMHGRGSDSVSQEMKQAAAGSIGMGTLAAATAVPQLVNAGKGAIEGMKNPSKAVEAVRDAKMNKEAVKQAQKVESGKASDITGPEKEGSIGLITKPIRNFKDGISYRIDKATNGASKGMTQAVIGAGYGATPYLKEAGNTMLRAGLVTAAGAVASELDTNVGKSLQHYAMGVGLNKQNGLIKSNVYQHSDPIGTSQAHLASEYSTNFDLSNLMDNNKKPLFIDKTGVVHNERVDNLLENNGSAVRFAPMNENFVNQYRNNNDEIDFKALQNDISYAAMVKDENGNDYIGMAYTVSKDEMGLNDPKISALNGHEFANRCANETALLNRKEQAEYRVEHKGDNKAIKKNGNVAESTPPKMHEAVVPKNHVKIDDNKPYNSFENTSNDQDTATANNAKEDETANNDHLDTTNTSEAYEDSNKDNSKTTVEDVANESLNAKPSISMNNSQSLDNKDSNNISTTKDKETKEANKSIDRQVNLKNTNNQSSSVDNAKKKTNDGLKAKEPDSKVKND